MKIILTFILLNIVLNISLNDKVSNQQIPLDPRPRVNYMGVEKTPMIEPITTYKLPPHTDINVSPPTPLIETLNDNTAIPNVYYNGAIGLKTTYSVCHDFVFNPKGCVQNSQCGWCEKTKTCIQGTSSGSSSCDKGFIFNAPNTEWNPIIHDNLIGYNLRKDQIFGASLNRMWNNTPL